MPPRQCNEAVIPHHIRGRRARIRDVEATEQMGDGEVEFGVGDMHADARPRAPRKRREFALHLARDVVQPALGPEDFGVVKDVGVPVVDKVAGADDGLEAKGGFGQWGKVGR